MPLPLSQWANFYVITGSSAAALTGIMFVVVALVADRVQRRQSEGVSAFSTPTVAHFSIVLLLASIMSIPGHGALSLGLCIGGCAILGLISSARAGLGMGKVEGYTPEAEDWAWHVIIPLATYAVLLAGVFLLGTAPQLALVVIAAVALGLIFIGIHNAWDVAVYIVTQPVLRAGGRDATAVPPPVEAVPVAAAVTAVGDGPAPAKPV